MGNEIVTVSSRALLPSRPVPVRHAAPPVPHAEATAPPRARPRQASAHHPPVLHELTKFAPTAPPNPTPAPVASALPNPMPTQQVSAPVVEPTMAAVPISVPTAQAVAVAIKVPPTAGPSAAPSAAPTQAPATPAPPAPPAPSAAPAKPAAVLARTAPKAQVRERKPGVPSPGPTTAPSATLQAHGRSLQPGPKATGSPGPSPRSRATRPSPVRPVQVPPTPRPTSQPPARKRPSGLNARLRGLIPTGPVTPRSKRYEGNLGAMVPALPTPPPSVLARTKYIFQESPGAQHWKIWPFGAAPEERYIKMYVTSIRRVGPAVFCTGWLVRVPAAGNAFAIVEPNVTALCTGHLEPFVQPAPTP